MAERLVDKVTKDLLQYYHKPQEALMRYVYKMRESVERSKMFGMTATNDSM